MCDPPVQFKCAELWWRSKTKTFKSIVCTCRCGRSNGTFFRRTIIWIDRFVWNLYKLYVMMLPVCSVRSRLHLCTFIHTLTHIHTKPIFHSRTFVSLAFKSNYANWAGWSCAFHISKLFEYSLSHINSRSDESNPCIHLHFIFIQLTQQ